MVQVTTDPAEKSPDHPKKGIWCPRHPDMKLVRTDLSSGKFDLRCPGCTGENIIQFRPRPKPQPRLMSHMIGVPSFTFDGFDPRDPDPA